MEVEIFTLCDFAQDNHGKLTIVGTFDNINVNSFPSESPNYSIAMRLRVANSEAGNHTMHIKCLDENGVEINNLALKAEFTVMPNQKAPYSGINLVLNLKKPLRFERPGRLNFELYLDDDWARAIPLMVSKRSPQMAA